MNVRPLKRETALYHVVWGITAAVGLLALLPLLYLLLRALGAEETLIETLFTPSIIAVVGNSLTLTALVMIGAALIGVPFAWLTSRTDLPLSRLWLTLGILPMVIPTYLIAVTFVFAFGPRGLLQEALEVSSGVERLPPIYGLFGTWLVLTLCTFPYVALPLRAVFRSMALQLEEAALDLGANRWQTFWRVLLPQCAPALCSGMMLAGLYSLCDFGAAAVMRYNNFTRVIYLQYTSAFDRERAALLALLMVIFTIALLMFERWMSRRASVPMSGTPSQPKPIRLGRWRAPAVAYCAIVTALGVGTPTGILIHWLLTRTMTRQVEYSPFALTLNTLGLSGTVALLCMIVALPIAALVQASPSRFNRVLARLPYLTYALPGVVIGLASVFFMTRYLPVLYQTLPVLLVAYTLRFLPLSISTTETSFGQVNARLVETAQSLGAGKWQIFARLLLPLSRSGVLSGGALVFLAVMKELPIGLMLAPTGFHTLSYRIWSAYQEAIFSQIGPAGLILMLVSLLSANLILRVEAGGNHSVTSS